MGSKTDAGKAGTGSALAEQLTATLADRRDLFGRIPAFDENAAVTLSEADLLQAIANAASAEEAAEIVHNQAGIVPFSDKGALSLAGDTFKILRIGLREGKSFDSAASGYEDDVACVIEIEGGRRQILTFEQNPKRNLFLLAVNEAIRQFGFFPNCALQKYDKKEPGQVFYAIVPSQMWVGDRPAYQEPRRVN